MSEIKGPLSAGVFAVTDTLDQLARLPEQRRRLAHAGAATELLAWCVYLWPIWGHRSGTAFEVGAGVAGVAVLWLVASWWAFRSERPRDSGAMCWALVHWLVCAVLLWWRVYPTEWGPVAVFLTRGFYFSLLMANVVKFAIAAQLLSGSGNALRVVTRHNKQRAKRMIPAGARRSRAGPWAVLGALAVIGFGVFCFLW